MNHRSPVKQKWDCTVNWLRREFPPPNPCPLNPIIEVNVKKMNDGVYGECSYESIDIHKTNSFFSMLQTLFHEWAHLITRDEWHLHITANSMSMPDGSKLLNVIKWKVAIHSDEWALAYAKILRAFYEWNFKKKNELSTYQR